MGLVISVLGNESDPRKYGTKTKVKPREWKDRY